MMSSKKVDFLTAKNLYQLWGSVALKRSWPGQYKKVMLCCTILLAAQRVFLKQTNQPIDSYQTKSRKNSSIENT